MLLLAGDIGGTKTDLAIFEDACYVREERFPSPAFSSLEEIVQKFLREKVERACFGVAGPIVDGKSRITNLPWIIEAEKISKEFKIPHVALINDLEATAWGVGCLKEEEFAVLNVGKNKTGNRAVIAAGTGLGEAGLVWDGKRHVPFACEGGHTDFAPRNRREFELWEWLHKKYGHVSYERVVSGPGIEDLQAFLSEKKLALEQFASLYGAEAGNLALKFLALGGVYLGGGIAPQILSTLKKENLFMNGFTSKGRFGPLLSEIPVKVILNDRAALLGAAAYANRF